MNLPQSNKSETLAQLSNILAAHFHGRYEASHSHGETFYLTDRLSGEAVAGEVHRLGGPNLLDWCLERVRTLGTISLSRMESAEKGS